MSRKRRMFEIEMPDDGVSAEPDFPAGKDAPARRGPMAAAITETAESSRDRARLEAQIRAENDALAQEHVRLKRAGLITDLVPLDAIDTHKLIRDRAAGPDYELAELVESIRDIGLSNPIRVEPAGEGRYELIQGWRRLSAYRQLLAETGDHERWGRIPAGIAAKGEALEALYRRMVDENLVRKDISFAEMAQLALHYAMDPLTPENDPEKAVAILFKSAGYQKRSYIRSFIRLVEALDGALMYPAEIPRALGLALSQRLDEVPGTAAAIRAELKDWDTRSIKDELDILRRYAGQGAETEDPARPGRAATPIVPAGKAKTTFQIERPQGNAKCTAANGRLEIRLPRDFTAVDRRRLEAAVRVMLESLD
ncbi:MULTISPECIES: ParB/RepB/Spo0J family partition protein [unclassified Paracoccus (in: a-proteobacteria)]|uniref:ParB/RepB/Spo0J family partition protein n=1 Tax=unclassified Paracoccus (in: a-proteobacteria) TaxID=2688777 RepID=UPI0012B2483B|nr:MULTISPECIES: ParB N-terminal domain-containing protein [unclassified Paracoccus (in: a-proteobacteria)]UXU76313.1 ParB N-terminal domain-containing protein [Paracoccus sp. SMMA_5]UXU82350.1 ParB N-terminal domain-containing protein [Paracoccus sp. SMMA_5_TC]